MAEYVTKEQVIDWFRPYGHLDEPIPFETLASDLRGMKAADVAPVKPGRWIESEDEYGLLLTCSVCGEDFVSWEADCARTNYCPNCGSDMRGSDDER